LKPIIGITVESKHDPEDTRTRGKIELNWNYGQAIADAGGVPLVIPPMADMEAVARVIDGWLIPGGLDIDAAHFGEETHEACELQDPSRFEAESSLFRLIPKEMPILGICYGCQFINVISGGSLIQHLPDVEGAAVHTGGPTQRYWLDEDSKLKQIVSESEVHGKSYHHQAIKAVGANLSVVAKAEDGVIEAVESQDRPWLIGVQWHPERTLDSPESVRLFTNFIEAAIQFARYRK